MAEKNPLSESLRAEIIKLATDGDPKGEGALTADVLAKIMRVAKTGRDLLVSLSANPSNLSLMVPGSSSEDGTLMQSGSSTNVSLAAPFAYTAPQENFGMIALRELIAAAKEHMGGKNRSPADLVEAIAVARENGLDDVARELEGKLGIRKEEKPAADGAPDGKEEES